MKTSQRRSLNLVRTVPVHLMRPSEAKDKFSGAGTCRGLVKTSQRRSLNLVRTVPVHLMRLSEAKDKFSGADLHVQSLLIKIKIEELLSSCVSPGTKVWWCLKSFTFYMKLPECRILRQMSLSLVSPLTNSEPLHVYNEGQGGEKTGRP